MSKDLYINGPINAVRLEGNGKVIYVFMDYHEPVNYQTECETSSAKDLKLYLVEELSKINDKEIDFFMEIYRTYISVPSSSFRGRYIDEVHKFFKSTIKMDKDKNLGTTFGTHIRFHWVDIRDFFESGIWDNIHEIIDVFKNALCHIDSSIPVGSLTYVRDKLTIISQRTSFVYNLFDKKIVNMVGGDSENKDSVDEIDSNIKKIMGKLNDRYSHPDIYIKLQHIYKTTVEKFKKLTSIINHMTSLVDEYIEFKKSFDSKLYKLTVTKDSVTYFDGKYNMKAIFDMNSCMDDMLIECLFSFVNLVDMYFLRRFVDKDYVKHAIVYTGIAHSIQYVYTLVKEFDMKITHASYIKTDIDSAMKTIKSNEECDVKIDELFYPPYLMQCTNLTEFPEKFE